MALHPFMCMCHAAPIHGKVRLSVWSSEFLQSFIKMILLISTVQKKKFA